MTRVRTPLVIGIRFYNRPDTSGIKKTKVYAKGLLEHFDIQEKGRFLADYKEDQETLSVKVK
jgi:hypothetical protein